MSLQAKLLVVVALVLCGFAAVEHLIQHSVVLPAFVELEHQQARQDMQRAVDSLDREIHHLDLFLRDWAIWDDTYRFAQDRNPEYVRSNLTSTVFSETSLNVVWLFDRQGRTVWGRAVTLDPLRPIRLPEFPEGGLPAGHPLVHHEGLDRSVSGILMTGSGPLLVASRPVLTSERRGPPRGALVMGRFLTTGLRKTIAQQARVDLHVLPFRRGGPATSDPDVLRAALGGLDDHLVDKGGDGLRVYQAYPDIQGRPALVMQANFPRDVSRKGRSAIEFAEFSLLAIGAILLLVTMLGLRITVLSPLSRLARHVQAIDDTGDLTARFTLNQKDEIGDLARQFNQMVAHLAQLRAELLDRSFRAGVSEAAEGVLHNVRNALSPLLARIEGLQKDLAAAPLQHVETARAEVAGGRCAPERREALQRFLDLERDNLAATLNQMGPKVDEIRMRAVSIGDVLAAQDRFSRVERPAEYLSLDELLHDAIAMMPDRLRAAATFSLDPSVADAGKVWAHRTTLLQVFGNLLVNAAEAIQRVGSGCGSVEVRAEPSAGEGAREVRLRFQDNGAGIAPEDLERIFRRGQTSKADSSGLGLHWSANAVAAMGGRLFAESSGVGQGACMNVLLPQHTGGGSG